VAAPPTGIDWDALSLRSREIVLHIVMPLAGSVEYSEVAERLNRNRPEFIPLLRRPNLTFITRRAPLDE
jgi:hypothetical protein